MFDIKALAEELDDLRERLDADPEDGYDPLDEDDRVRLASLESLESDLGGDLHIAANRGYSLIRDDDFAEHAREMAEDMHPRDAFREWPFTCIDWDQAADELRHDYTAIEWEGEIYYTRDV